MKTAPAPFTPTESRMILEAAPANLSRYQGQECTVFQTEDFRGSQVVHVRFDDGTIRCLFASYLKPVPLVKSTRRPPLTLKPDADTRDEAERMDEGVAFLEKRGYTVLRVGQGKVSAVCHKCSRENKQLTPIFCKVCNSRGFSPSTNSTEGTPDTFISHPEWPVACWLGQEWKDAERGERTKEQKILEAAGRIVVAWNLESCLAQLAQFERTALGREPHRDIAAYLSARSKDE